MLAEMRSAENKREVIDRVVERVLVLVVDVIAVGDRAVCVFPNCSVQVLDETDAADLNASTEVDPIRTGFRAGVSSVAAVLESEDFRRHVLSITPGVRLDNGFQPAAVQIGWSAVPTISRPSSVVSRHVGLCPVSQARST